MRRPVGARGRRRRCRRGHQQLRRPRARPRRARTVDRVGRRHRCPAPAARPRRRARRRRDRRHRAGIVRDGVAPLAAARCATGAPTRSPSPATSRWRVTARGTLDRASTSRPATIRWSVAVPRLVLVGPRVDRRDAARSSRPGTRPARPRCGSSTSRPARCAGRRRSARARAAPVVARRARRARGRRLPPPRVGRGARPRHRRAAVADAGAGVVRGSHRAGGRRSDGGGGRPLRGGHDARPGHRAAAAGSTTSPAPLLGTRVTLTARRVVFALVLGGGLRARPARAAASSPRLDADRLGGVPGGPAPGAVAGPGAPAARPAPAGTRAPAVESARRPADTARLLAGRPRGGGPPATLVADPSSGPGSRTPASEVVRVAPGCRRAEEQPRSSRTVDRPSRPCSRRLHERKDHRGREQRPSSR